MTLQDYVAQRPDLAQNWENAHASWDDDDGTHFDDSWAAQWIRSFPSFEAYAENDYGQQFDSGYQPPPPPSLPPMPPITFSAAAANYVTSRPDLVNNWGQAWNPANANDGTAQWIRSFGSFQAYIEHDHGGPFNVVTPPATVVPPVAPPVNPGTVTPPYVPPTSGGSPGVNLPPTGVSPFFDPTHRLIGHTAAGPIYMLIDEGGSIITWIETANGIMSTSNAGKATKSAALTAAELTRQLSGAGTVTPPPIVPPGTVTPPSVNLPPGGISPNFDPTHRLVGYTREGYEVYRLTDEGGHLVEWYDIPGQGAQGEHYLTGPNDSSTYVYATTRPAVTTPGGSAGTSASKSSMGTILLLAGAAAVAFFAGRSER